MTEYITELINNDKPFIFAKFGDGEYAAANGWRGGNCDGDPYTDKLKKGIIDAIQYYSLLDNAYCGRWHTGHVGDFFNSIVPGKINWLEYHTCIMDQQSFSDNKKLLLFKAIKDSKRKKLLVGNELLTRAQYLLNLDKHIIVPYRHWVDKHYDMIYNEIVNFFEKNSNPLIITCAGMGSKILIKDLHKKFPNGIFIDIGSGLDYICTKKCSRGNPYSYEEIENYFEDILPANWNDSRFNDIYKKAKSNIGIHLSK
jgi:hypothetical protein